MVSLHTPAAKLGSSAPPFDLPGVDGRRHTLASVRGANGLVVMFICNHCPYVKAVIDKIPRDMRELASLGVGAVAIMSNDPALYPEDSFDNMKAVAERHAFGFPYLFDETQDVARAYGAVCTPDFFGYDRDLGLVYRGRLDDAGRTPREGNRRDLVEAMRADDTLYEYAFDRRVVVVTASTLLATLRTVNSLWRFEDRNRNALRIADEAGKLHDKFVGFVGDLKGVESSFDKSRSLLADALAKLVAGKGNLVRKTDLLRRLGAKTAKALDAELLAQAGEGDEAEAAAAELPAASNDADADHDGDAGQRRDTDDSSQSDPEPAP